MIRNIEQLLDHLFSEIKSRVDIAVVGLSGGADSSLTAILSMQALGKENVYGISMPYNEVDLETFNAQSASLAARIGINHLVRPISKIADAINDQIYINSESELTVLNKGNSRSRGRMCILYGISRNLETLLTGKRVRVMGTGNLSEDFIGYDTKGGDALADIFAIGELFKSEVYQLLEHFRDKGTIDENHINRIPSAGLMENQTDEADLGYSYNQMERGVRFCLQHYDEMSTLEHDEITDFVWQRHLIHKHKHEAPYVISLRSFCD
jgi:NAD+ synthase